MSIHARTDDFSMAAPIKGLPDLAGAFKPSAEAQWIKEYNIQNDPSLAGRRIATNARSHGNVRSHSEEEKEKEKQANARLWQGLQLSDGAITRLLDKLSVSIGTAIDWLRTDSVQAQQVHLSAARNVTVNPADVLLDDRTGKPMSLNQKLSMDQENRSCSVGFTMEELVVDANGQPLMDASGTNYYNKDMQARMDEALATVQDNDALIKQMQKGDLEFSDLPKEKQIDLLSGQSPDVKARLYDEAGYSEEERLAMDELTAPKPEGLLAELANPETAIKAFSTSLQFQPKLTPSF